MCNPQQRSRHAAAALQLAGVAHLARHIGGLVARGGEARRDIARRSGRLASRPVGRAPHLTQAAQASPVAPAERQDVAREACGARSLRRDRSAAA